MTAAGDHDDLSQAAAEIRPVSAWSVVFVLWRREMVRMVRQPVRLAAAVGTPALLWLMLTSGLAGSIRGEGANDASYALFLLPGMMTLVVMFSAIFSSISIIEDRREGWLQAALVAPVPRWSIALGKISGGATVAWLQAALLLPAAALMGQELNLTIVALVLMSLGVTSLALAGVGVALAWRCETVAGFHAVMNLLFMPMWMLSGAFFPPEGAARALAWLLAVNPLAWCTQAIRAPLLGEAWAAPLSLSCAFALAMILLATWMVSRPSNRLA